MKLRYLLLLLCTSLFGCGILAHADYSLTREQFFSSYVDVASKDMTPSDAYQHIVLKYTGINTGTAIYQTMQKAVYYKFFPNGRIVLSLATSLTEAQACAIIKRTFPIDTSCEIGKGASPDRLNLVLDQIKNIQKKQNPSIDVNLTSQGYLDENSLRQISEALSSANTTDKNLFYSSLQNILSGVKDPYTVFFPPTEATQFNEELQGEFEGIGAYVEMENPGELIIDAPIIGSPADEAGLLAGDRILKIDTHRITEKTNTSTAVNRIKGPAGTTVKILIMRGKKILTFTLMRQAIVVKNISAKTYNASTCYMNIAMFGHGASDEFIKAINSVFGKNKCKKYIFDVRNNPGGSLEEVSNMLAYFVPTGEATVIVDSPSGEEKLYSTAIDGKKLMDKKITILINQQSASASEIFAGTIKDYIPSTVLIGDTTYGKGSVQELLQYNDGSMLKYTIAKWYTGKSRATIDHTGVSPDVKISDNPKTLEDEQLQRALK